MFLIHFLLMQNILIPKIIKDLDVSYLEKHFKNNGLYFIDAVNEYKIFLTLKIMKFDVPIKPSESVISIWKLHILYIENYIQDCNQIFGKLLKIDETLI